MVLDGNANQRGQNCAANKETCSGQIPFPSCWNDAKRMEVLYAPFRERDVNPENYDSKMKFWLDMIEVYCMHTGTAVFSEAALKTAFVRGNRMPYSLDTVISELYRNKKIRLYAEYENDPLNGWSSWAMNGLVWRPLTWGVNRLKSIINKYQEANTDYVHLAALKKFCEKLQTEVLPPEKGKLMHYVAFKQLAAEAHIHLKDKTLYLCLITLNYQKRLALEFKTEDNLRAIHLIKVPASNDPSSHVISETDHAIHQLQMTQCSLHDQLEDLETEIVILDKKVRQLVNDNKRGLAKTYLRKKHLLEKNHAKRAQALQNIEELMNGVEEARTHGQIIDAYKIGSKALQGVLNTTGLNYNNIDEVVADVRESLDANRDVEDALAKVDTTQNLLEENEEREIESELQDIINDERIQKAPNVPEHIPGTITPPRELRHPLSVTIKDAELLAMLDQLELEESGPGPSTAAKNNNNRNIYS